MRWVAVGVWLALLCACRPVPDNTEAGRYRAWLDAGRASEADAYAGFLQRQAVGDALPMQQLLRSGRRWRRCHAEEFAIPPRKAWRAMAPTLALVAALQHDGVLPDAQAVSVYRGAALNRCEGGSGRSRHLANNAIDFDLEADDAARVERLCRYWRTHGRRSGFGLGFYDARRIHVDTGGFRTWGLDYTRRTSLCALRQ